MLEFLIDSTSAIFGGRVFQQTVGIPMGTICAPPLFPKSGVVSLEEGNLIATISTCTMKKWPSKWGGLS
jgi:hypothetical protein